MSMCSMSEDMYLCRWVWQTVDPALCYEFCERSRFVAELKCSPMPIVPPSVNSDKVYACPRYLRPLSYQECPKHGRVAPRRRLKTRCDTPKPMRFTKYTPRTPHKTPIDVYLHLTCDSFTASYPSSHRLPAAGIKWPQ